MGTYLFAECSLHIDVEEDDDEVEDRVISNDGEPSTDEEIEHGVAVAQNTGPQMLSRNGAEIWLRRPGQQQRAQHRRHDILREAHGPSRQAIESGCGDSPARAFKVYTNMEIVNIIVLHTNQEARRHDTAWLDTDAEEMYVFLGLLLLAGVYHAKNEAIVQLWSRNNGRPIFSKAMPRDRYDVHVYTYLVLLLLLASTCIQ